jgi:hypothetical protein
MTLDNFSRFFWQVPLLIMLVAVLMPEVSWISSAFGLWPVWLLSMPFTAFIRYVYLARDQTTVNHATNQSQVLVFQKKPSNIIIRERGHSKAA